jgi:hypothetical protein
MNAAAERAVGASPDAPRYFAPARPGVSPTILKFFLGLAFFMGVLNHVTVRLVGLMPVNEILLGSLVVMGFLWIVLYQRLPAPLTAPRVLTIFLAAQLIGLISYIIADLYRESYTGDMIRGWSRMVFLVINIVGFSLLFGASNRCFVFLQIGMIFSFVDILVSGPLFGDYWKFGFAYPVTIAVLMSTPRLLPRSIGLHASVGACFFLAGLQSVMDFRSLGGVCFCVGALLCLRYFPTSWRKTICIGGAIILLAAFPFLAKHALGDTGERGTRSNVERSAMLQAAWEGFYRSPLIGQGSWFSRSNVMDEFLLIRASNARLAGVGGFDDTDAGDMAIHSQILVALAEGGFFGATFFFVYGCFLLWGFWYCVVRAPWDWILPTRFFVLLVAFWNLLMSPFSGPHRVEIALAVGLVLILWRESTQLKAGPPAAFAGTLSKT